MLRLAPRAGLLLLLLGAASAASGGRKPIIRERHPKRAVTHQQWGSDPWYTSGGRRKQFVLACNAFADKKPAIVGVRTAEHVGAEAEAATLHLPLHERGGLAHFLRTKDVALQQRRSSTLRGVAGTKGALIPELAKGGGAHTWALRAQKNGETGEDSFTAKPIYYGTCQEHHVDLSSRRMFFVTPDEQGSCLLTGDLPSAEMDEDDDGEVSARFVVVLTQKDAHSSDCAVVAMSLDRGEGAGAKAIAGEGGVSAELAVVDAFAQDHPLVPYLSDAEAEERDEEDWEVEEVTEGADLALGSGAVVRLEDIVDKQAITTELVASRTLSLGQVYDVEPKELHVILEDLRGSKMSDERDVNFEADKTYVAIRLGRAGDKDFPEKLAFFPLSESSTPPEDPPKVPAGGE